MMIMCGETERNYGEEWSWPI